MSCVQRSFPSVIDLLPGLQSMTGQNLVLPNIWWTTTSLSKSINQSNSAFVWHPLNKVVGGACCMHIQKAMTSGDIWLETLSANVTVPQFRRKVVPHSWSAKERELCYSDCIISPAIPRQVLCFRCIPSCRSLIRLFFYGKLHFVFIINTDYDDDDDDCIILTYASSTAW